jgi:hypothetical protein
MSVETLTDDACIAILAQVGTQYVGNTGLNADTTVKLVVAMAEADGKAIPGWILGKDMQATEAGPKARAALEAALASDDKRLRDLTSKAIEKYSAPAGQVIDLAIIAAGGGILLALAIIAKVKYSKKKGWEIEPGFPGLADVLDKAGSIIKAATGVPDTPSKDAKDEK